jgi:hypothetical protein
VLLLAVPASGSLLLIWIVLAVLRVTIRNVIPSDTQQVLIHDWMSLNHGVLNCKPTKTVKDHNEFWHLKRSEI